MAYFQKGMKKVEGSGMKKGFSYTSKELKELMKNFSIDKFHDFEESFDKLTPKAKCATYLQVVKFVIPTISSVAFEDAKNASTAIELLRAVSQYGKGEEETGATGNVTGEGMNGEEE